jgi:hypothetical protein
MMKPKRHRVGIGTLRILVTSVVTASFLVLSALAFADDSSTEGSFEHPKHYKDYEDFDPSIFDEPTNFVNEWLPLKPGVQWVYEGFNNENGERIPHRIVYAVTDLTKVIGGVRTVVVWIEDFSDGEIVEKEIAFFAQANDGSVWYLGEYPEAYEDGELVEAPAWIAGLDDAQAGIAMRANPQVGAPSYSQGWAPSIDWTDRARVYKMGEETCVPVDCFRDVLVMDEYSAGEPGFKLKYYARGVGQVRVGWRGRPGETLELVEHVQLGPEELAKVREKALSLEKSAYEISKDVYAHTEQLELTAGQGE